MYLLARFVFTTYSEMLREEKGGVQRTQDREEERHRLFSAAGETAVSVWRTHNMCLPHTNCVPSSTLRSSIVLK